MILVDTSVWIDHFRKGDDQLADLLGSDAVLMHPFVLAEIALGNLNERTDVLASLSRLPSASIARHAELLRYIEENQLFGQGVGYVDAHILASVRLTSGASLWTRDRRLSAAAAKAAVPSYVS